MEAGVSPFVAYFAGIGTVVAAIGVGFTGGVMLTSTDFIRKDHAQTPSSAQAGKPATPERAAAVPAVTAPPEPAPEPRATTERADDKAPAHLPPEPPALPERRAADAEAGTLMTPVRPVATDQAAEPPRIVERPSTTSAAEPRKSRAAVRERKTRDAQRPRRPANDNDDGRAAAETTGTVTREIIVEYGVAHDDDDDAMARRLQVRRPHGILEFPAGR
jgi:hypothetical protein